MTGTQHRPRGTAGVGMGPVPTLTHPFDDPLFAAMAGEAGIARDQLPEEYDPGLSLGNDGITDEVPGMPNFEFLCGDASYLGHLMIDLDQWGEARYRVSNGWAFVETPDPLPQTVLAALVGRRCGEVIDVERFAGWATCETAGWLVDAAADDPDRGTIMRLMPPDGA